MPVIGGPRTADHRRPEPGQHLGQLATVEHAVFEAEIAGFDPHLLHHRMALVELLFAQTELNAAVAFVADIDPGALAEFGGEARPLLGGQAAPALVMRRAQALALHPNEPEIAARGTEGDVALIDDRAIQPGPGNAVGNGRANQPAADHDRVKPLHSPSARSRAAEPESVTADRVRQSAARRGGIDRRPPNSGFAKRLLKCLVPRPARLAHQYPAKGH